ncbi:MAG: hypothetical protein NTV98_05855, partial [Candidatus Roizmanbacteria bacterium]|nr:hypothetical protein [Candidatus Roizmanbacteria bacterium]
LDDEDLEKVANKFSEAVGYFLIHFSTLEHELNIAIAELMSNGSHEQGYLIIERLTFSHKIDLFYKISLRYVSYKKGKFPELLKELQKRLIAINSFRNIIVHANWQSMTKDGFIRSKIIVDDEEGYIKFKRTQLTKKVLTDQIKEIYKLTNELYSFYDEVIQG